MADISKIQIPSGSAYSVRDYKVPAMSGSTNTYLNGEGSWQVPINPSVSSGCIFIDCGDHLRVIIS